MANWKRRRFLATLPLLLSPQRAAAIHPQQKNYRIDVVIQAWGIPVFARRGVGQGSGSLHWERHGAEERLRFELGAAAYAPADCQTIINHSGDRRLCLESRRRGTSEGVLVEATVSGKNRHCFRYLLPASTLPELPDRIEYQPKAWLKLTLVSLATTEESA